MKLKQKEIKKKISDFENYKFLASIPIKDQWNLKLVEERLIEAIRLAEFVVTNPMPNKTKSNWVRYRYEWSDLLSQVESPTDAKKIQRYNLSVSKKNITQMEQALRWPTLYLKDFPGPARVLSTFLKARAKRQSFSELIRKNHWSKATAYRAKEKALTLIAIGLMKDKIFPQ